MLLNFSFANDAVGYMIEGDYDREAIELLEAELLKKFKEFDKIKIYLEDSGIYRFRVASIFNTFIFPFKHRGKFSKIALVTDRKWIHCLAYLNSILISAKLRKFTTCKRQKALDWINLAD
ncbi:MAG: STAS/SEC14 domain-containing protein [Flavobacteriaceae bacterium]|nr:STAS/SEC14 domain-containing protein [Flavobacteriaceae bacterium]